MPNEISIDAVITEMKRQLGEDQFALATQRAAISTLQADVAAKEAAIAELKKAPS